MTYKLLCGDSHQKLHTFPNNSIDAIVTDPPYELGFMGKKWDTSGIAYNIDLWKECLRVLKPGGHLLAFGGTRTHHRMTCAIEDAGFEIRDELDWVYGSGFPKSLNVSKAIDRELGQPREVAGRGEVIDRTALDYGGATGKAKNGLKADWIETEPNTKQAADWKGWGTALKPGREPIVLARKPFDGTIAKNVLTYGTGGLNIDGCRIGASTIPATKRGVSKIGTFEGAENHITPEHQGRWPANIIFDEDAAAELDAHTGIQKSGVAVQRNGGGQAIFGGIAGNAGSKQTREDVGYGDIGGASRFFYVAKASRSEREAGCESLPPRLAQETVGRDPDSAGARNPRAGAGRGAGTPILRCTKCTCDGGGGRYVSVCNDGRPHDFVEIGKGEAVRNYHPTVKPIELMRYLVRLITPPNGLVLDPFTGSGTTGCACMLEGMNFVGIELDKGHIEIAKARIEYWKNAPPEKPKVQRKKHIHEPTAELPL